MFGKKKICVGCEKQVKKVDELQLCEYCRKSLDIAVERLIEIIDDTIRIVDNTKSIDTFLGRIKTYTECVNQLKSYVDRGYKIDRAIADRCKEFSDRIPDKAVALVSAKAKAVRERKRKSDKAAFDISLSISCIEHYGAGIRDMQNKIVDAYRSYITTGKPSIETVLQIYYNYKRWVVCLNGGSDYLIQNLSTLKEPENPNYCWAHTAYFLEVDFRKDNRNKPR